MAQQHIALTADNILNRSEMTRFERSDYKKKLVSANHGNCHHWNFVNPVLLEPHVSVSMQS